jgi:hypothetical protein
VVWDRSEVRAGGRQRRRLIRLHVRHNDSDRELSPGWGEARGSGGCQKKAKIFWVRAAT